MPLKPDADCVLLTRRPLSLLRVRRRALPRTVAAESRNFGSSGDSGIQPVTLSYSEFEPSKAINSDESIVICHGLYGSKNNWRGPALRLTNLLGMRVFTIDMRNHGRSPHARPHTSRAMAEDLSLFFKQRNMTGGVHLIGHSMGAKAAMMFALTSRLNSPLCSLTAIDMAPTTEPIEPQYADYARGMLEIEEAQVTTKLQADEILRNYEPLDSVRQFLLTNSQLVSGTASGTKVIGFRCALRALSEAIPTLGDFTFPAGSSSGSWTGPTLFLRGGQSEYVTSSNLPSAYSLFPNLKLVTIGAAGHWVHADAPNESVSAISDFIRTVSRSSRLDI